MNAMEEDFNNNKQVTPYTFHPDNEDRMDCALSEMVGYLENIEKVREEELHWKS